MINYVLVFGLVGLGNIAAWPLQIAAQANGAPPVRAYTDARHDIAIGDFAWVDQVGDSALPGDVKAMYHGTVQVTAVARASQLKTLTFIADSTTVTWVVDQRGQSLPYTSARDSVTVTLARAAAPGDTIHVTLGFTGERPKVFTQFTGSGAADSQPQPRHFVIMEGWHLAPMLPGDQADQRTWGPWSITATLSTGDQLQADGRFVFDSTLPNAQHRLQWREDHPDLATGKRFELTIANLGVEREVWTGPNGQRIPLSIYYAPEKAKGAQGALGVIERGMNAYAHLTDVPYAYTNYELFGASGVDFGGGGGTWTGTASGASSNLGSLPDPRFYVNQPTVISQTAQHELAHTWLIAGPPWVIEGGANFMVSRYWAAEDGPRRAQEIALGWEAGRKTFEKEGVDPPGPVGDDYRFNIYNIGAIVFDMLHRYLGDDKFRASMRIYLAKYTRSNTTAELVAAIRDATGEDLGWFFQEWIFGAGNPKFTVTAAYDTVAQRVTVHVQQTQDTTDGVPAAFEMPVTVRVGTPRGDVVAESRLNARTQTIVIDRVPAPPTMVVFDDKDGIYKDLNFEQPTAWLVTQLRREPSPWQTWWVANQLGARAARDTMAKAALVAGARDARYPLTRQQVLAAADGAGLQLPLEALARALHDSSAQVREAAITSLPQRSVAEALPLLMKAFEQEPTDILRGKIVGAALRLQDWTDDSAKAVLLGRALRVPSVENVVRIRALDLLGAGTACYDTLVPEVEALLGQYIEAVRAARRLGNQCPAYKALLDRYRDDSRLQVRRWIRQVARESKPD